MHSNEIENYKRSLQLTKRQRAIVVGTLLGDGHLETRDGRTYRLRIEHSIKQKEYVDWLYNELKEWVRAVPQMRTVHSQFPQGHQAESQKYGFITYAHGALRFYGQQFYTKDGKKIVPKLINKMLTPISIAIWYLDDGSVKSNRHRTYIIHSHGYTNPELKRLQKTLFRFRIKTTLHRQNRAEGLYWRIYVSSESAKKIRGLLEPIIADIPSMRYKLGNIMPKE